MSTISENAKAIFLEAVEKRSPKDWPEFLDQACGNDRTLRGHVEGLLHAHGERDSLFDEPQSTRDYVPLVRPGQSIGPYKIREQIGDGGMGVVYVAEQEQPLRRKVALKVIKAGMDSKAVIARFEAERNALAMMNHPNIAKVLDAGTTEQGRPYFVMELIQGKPITEYCDHKKLTIQQRLELFTQICNAVQHAHQKGVIHRDIKPSNILVTEIDGKPVPKVIDFGVAKALGANLTDRTVYTSFQSLVGTPLYMSPEQAQLSGVDVDTSSDVYSLGILLYELLTGTTPLSADELKAAAQDEVLRRIRETEPPRPSNRISSLGETSSQVSECRGAQPEQLGRLVRGDLDWIVMKALEKDRSRRYKTADALAADIGRHLTSEPVEARPPSTAYRLSRFYRRNRVIVGVLAAIFLVAVVATTVMTAAWGEARRQATIARKNATEANAAKEIAQRTLDEKRQTVLDLGESAYREAVLAAISGDGDKASDALEICGRCKLPTRRIKIIEALLALNDGQNENAIKLATTSLNESAQAEYSLKIAATSILAVANCFAGFDDVSFEHLQDLKGLLPNSKESLDRLFIAYASYIGNPQGCLDELDAAPDVKASPVGLMLASVARTMLGATNGDYEKLQEAIRDNEYVRLHFRENQLSLAYSIQAYAITIALAKAEGRNDEVVRLTQEAQPLALDLEQKPGFPGGFYILWMFYNSIDDEDKALRAIERVGNHSGTYSFFLSAELLRQFSSLEAAKRFDDLVKTNVPDSKYVRLARAHLVREADEGEKQVEMLVEDYLNDPSPLIRRFALMAMCLVRNSDEIERLASIALRDYPFGEEVHDAWGDEACVRYLAGDYSERELREAIEGRHFGSTMIELTIAMKHLSAGHRELAREHFQRCVELNQIFTFDYGFAEAYLTRMSDPAWPKWLNSDPESL